MTMDASQIAQLPPWMTIDVMGDTQLSKSVKESAIKRHGGNVRKRKIPGNAEGNNLQQKTSLIELENAHQPESNPKKVTKRKILRSERSRPVRDAPSDKYTHKLKLIFRQKCPKPSIIKNLHPKIAGVQVPKRPPSVKWCMLKFTSAESREEVKQALHMQQAPNIKGVLMCSIPVNETLSALPESKTGEGLTTKEVIHTLAVHNQVKTPVNVTMDFQINSTERELNVRFGVFSNTPVKRENSSET